MRSMPISLQVVHGGGQGMGLGNALGAGLEALRCGQVLGLLHGHGGDHGAAGQERRHGVEQFGAAVEAADAGGAEHLVPGKRHEVHIQRLDVHRQVRDRLAGVEHRQRADVAGQCHQRRHIGHGAQDVGDMGEGHDPGGGVMIDSASSMRRAPDSSTGMYLRVAPVRSGQFLPGNQVGVVFQLGDDDFVPCARARSGARLPRPGRRWRCRRSR